MELNETQKELVAQLVRHKLSQTDVFSVMLVLTKEEKAKEMLSFLKEKEDFTPDEIFQKAGEIAYGKEST